MRISNENRFLEDFPNITLPLNIRLKMGDNEIWSYVELNDFVQKVNILKADSQNYLPKSPIAKIDSMINVVITSISNRSCLQPQYAILQFESRYKIDYLPDEQQSLFFVLIDVFSKKEIIPMNDWFGFLSELSKMGGIWNQIS